MEGPRSPVASELPGLLEFLKDKLRPGAEWSISQEYPTALTPSNIHNMRIVTDEEKRVLSHAVLKPLVIKTPIAILKVGAIGSVVTDPAHRNLGLSTTVMQDCIDEATKQNCDIAILWTDLYDFYRRMGFELAGTEVAIVVDTPPAVPADGLRFSDDSRVSAEAIHRLYGQHGVASVRTVDEVRKFLAIPRTKVFTAWEANGQLAAYAIEGKGADLTGYIHEWGGAVSKLLPLLGWIRSKRQDSITIIAPRHARNLISQLETRGAIKNEGFLGMIKIVNFDQLAAKIKRVFRAEGIADIVLERTNDGILFGIGTELFTLREEQDVTRLLFGPVDFNALDPLSEATRAKLGKLLPVPLWMWGWDSV